MMTSLRRVATSNISRVEIEQLRQFRRDHAGTALGQILTAIADLLDEGAEEISFEGTTEGLTPSQIAARVKMSRTHVYKLLERGEIQSHAVGHELRIRRSELLEFESRLVQDRREFAERCATQQVTRTQAIDELTELL